MQHVIISLNRPSKFSQAQSIGAIEYTDRISAER